jgi:glycosyltransferase involved in cell wall biosynthesis
MRIPYEGMLAADGRGFATPLLVSIWGNDLTLHAPTTPLMRHYTRWTLQVAAGVHADCRRDVRLAQEWGMPADSATLVVPGNGGVRTEVFFPPARPVQAPVVFNPRGLRAYVRTDTFFRAIPLVLERAPAARFVCASMAGEPAALRQIEELGISQAVDLLEPMPHAQIADVFRRAQVVVSPAVHDGTPNSLLEGMACGCFPVAGDLESLREWIVPGRNGLLTDPADPRALADAILTALENEDLRTEAAGLNLQMIAERAEFRRNMERVDRFYELVARRG